MSARGLLGIAGSVLLVAGGLCTAAGHAEAPPPAHLVVVAGVVAASLEVGSTVTYTATVQNTGGAPAAATVVDTLPDAVVPVAAAVGGKPCGVGRQIACPAGAIAPGRSVSVVVVVQIASPGPIANTVGVRIADSTVSVDGAGGSVQLAAAPAAVPVAIPIVHPAAGGPAQSRGARGKSAKR